MALAVAGSPDDLFRALGDNIIWLLVAAFIFAGGIPQERSRRPAGAKGGRPGANGAGNVLLTGRGDGRERIRHSLDLRPGRGDAADLRRRYGRCKFAYSRRFRPAYAHRYPAVPLSGR